MTIPNTIVIYVKSNILGYSTFKLKPSNIVPSNKNDNFLFDPLVKLNKSSIDKFDEKKRKSIFFEKPLFNSLIVQSESFQPYRSLKQATKEGVIDNNISVMLSSLFSEGNTIYLKDKPYSIVNLDWRKGNWKIDTKLPSSTSSFPPQYPVQSIYYQHTMNSYYSNAVYELNQIPPDLREGKNYVPEDFQSPILPPSEPIPSSPSTELVTKPTIAQTQPPLSSPPLVNLSHPPPLLPSPPTPPTQLQLPPVIPDSSDIQQTNPPLPAPSPNLDNNQLQIENISRSDQSPSQSQQNIITEREINQSINRPIRRYSTLTRRRGRVNLGVGRQNEVFKFKQYFKHKNFYLLVKYIFNYLPPVEQEFVFSNSKKIISYQPPPRRQNVHELKYTQSFHNLLVDTISIAPLPNSTNTFIDSFIYAYGNNGESQLTKTDILNNILSYIQNNSNVINEYITAGQRNANLLNEKYANLNLNQHQPIREDEYLEKVNIIFGENYNYLVNKPSSMFTDERLNSPFTYPQDFNQLKSYLLNNMQFYDKLYPILEQIYNIKLLVIQKTTDYFTLLFKKLQTTQKVKYLFLYLNNDIYFPIEFKFKINNSLKIYYHFNENDLSIFPPIPLLLFVYGKCQMFTWPNITEDNFLLKNIFLSINTSYNRIKNLYPNPNNRSPGIVGFLRVFDTYFASPQNITSGGSQSGGEPISPQQGNLSVNTIPQVNRTPYLGRPTSISYYITITLYLAPGKDLDKSKLDEIKCQMRKDNISKSWAEIRNLRYTPQPIN